MSDAEEVVWAPAAHNRPTGTKRYHTRKDCPRGPENPVTRDRDRVEADEDWTECQWCRDDVDMTGETGPSMAAQLERMDPSEVTSDD